MTLRPLGGIAPYLTTALIAGGSVWSWAKHEEREGLAQAQQILDREHARRLQAEIDRRIAAERIAREHQAQRRAAETRAADALARLTAALEGMEGSNVQDPAVRRAMLARLNRLGADATQLWNEGHDPAAGAD